MLARQHSHDVSILQLASPHPMADQAVCLKDGDSALAVTASIAGILTLCFAISATTWFHVNSVRKADSEFLGLKTALDW